MPRAEVNGTARHGAAMLLIDMINDLEFEDGHRLLPEARRAASGILALAREARKSTIPVVFVNDNFGQWHSERSRIVDHCAREGARGRDIVLMLKPDADDFFVIKPQFSGFYSTNLIALLTALGVRRLILAGMAADICVLFTAADAHMRQYDLWVPADCVASPDPHRTRWALDTMANAMQAEVRPTCELSLEEWLAT